MAFKYDDFGIDPESNICPECGSGAFVVNKEKESWYCSSCTYSGTLKVKGYSRSHELNVFSPGQVAPDIMELYEKGLQRGASTGWPELDKIFTIRKGELTIIGGIPSHGKSYYIEALCMNLAFQQNWKIALFSPEHRPHSMHIARFVQKFTGRGFHQNSENRVSKQQVKDTLDWMTEHFYFLGPPEYSPRAILAAAENAKKFGLADALLVDPWNAIEHQRPFGMTAGEYIGKTLQAFKKFAQDMDMHVFVVAHPKKMERDKKTGLYPVPRPYDIAESALFYSMPDNVLAIYRLVDHEDPNIRNQIQVHVQKVKWESVGTIGMEPLNWRPQNGTFGDVTQSMESEYPWDAVFSPNRKRK